MRKILLLTILLLAFFVSAPDARAAVLSKAPNNLGLVGYWPLNEGAGTQSDDVSGKNKTVSGFSAGNESTVPAWVDGKFGKALQFVNISGQIGNRATISNGVVNMSTETSVSFFSWVKLSSASTASRIFTNGTGCSLNMSLRATYTGGRVYLQVKDSLGNQNYLDSGYVTPLNQWAHIGFTFVNGGQLTFYVNGIAVSQQAFSYTFADAGTTTASIGSPGCAYNDGTNGLIDDLRLYTRALSATDVSNLYKAGQVTRKAPDNLGLVGYWSLNEGDGSVAGDSTANGNNGTISGATWVDGKRGKALSFNGSNNYVDLNQDILDGACSGTISVWFKRNAWTENYTTIFTKSDGAAWNDNHIQISRYSNTDYVNLTISDNFSSTAGDVLVGPIDSGEWYLATMTWNGAMLLGYLNGVEQDSKSTTICVPSDSTRVSIGRGAVGTNRYFNGILDEVRIYNRPLSATEIANLFRSGEMRLNSSQNNKLTSGLVGLWSFDGPDVSGTTAYDRSGQANNGTISGAQTLPGRLGQGLYCTTDDQVSLPDIAAAGTSGSYSLWVKPDSNNVAQGWIDSNYDIFQWSGRLLYFRAGNQSAVSIASWQPDEWHHVVMTWNGTDYFGYIDGVQVTSGIQTGVRTGNLYLCRVDGGFSYSGSIDDVRIYNRALSANEVKQLYNLGR